MLYCKKTKDILKLLFSTRIKIKLIKEISFLNSNFISNFK